MDKTTTNKSYLRALAQRLIEHAERIYQEAMDVYAQLGHIAEQEREESGKENNEESEVPSV